MLKLCYVLNVLSLIMAIVIFVIANESVWLSLGALMLFVASSLNIISTMKD